jgi:TatD DNase family protein
MFIVLSEGSYNEPERRILLSKPMPHIIDTHCHLHFPAYKDTLPDVLRRMKEADAWAVTVGTTATTSQGGIEFARQHEGVHCTVGYHPEHLTSTFHDENEGQHEPYVFERIQELARDEKVVGIGETGLDFFRIDAGQDRAAAEKLQEDVFRQHVSLSQETGKPLVIHCREASNRLLSILEEEKRQGREVRGVMHCFTGDWEEAERILALGLHISFTGIITFGAKKSQDPEKHVHRVIERMPLDRMMIETDAPWLAPEPHRGQQNEPAYVDFVARKIAELRKMEYEEVCSSTTENAIKFFGL